jgi:hypothetical protein
MPLPFLMQAAKMIADRAQEAATNATALSNAVSVGAQAAAKAFSATPVGQQISAKAEDLSGAVGDGLSQVNAFLDGNQALSSVRDAGGHAAQAVGAAAGVAAGHVSGGAGHVVTGLSGFAQSGQIVEAAKVRHEAELARFKPLLEGLHRHASTLETQKHVVMGGSFQRFIELFERQKQRMNISEKDFQTHLSMTPSEVAAFEQVRIEAHAVAGAAAQSVLAGAAVGGGAIGLAVATAAASTGTAIGSLSGAAATNALLAWFGGGSIATGGMGMAGGAMVIGGIFVAPALGVATLIAANKGHEALTKATAYSAEIDVACANLRLKTAVVAGLEARIEEVAGVLKELDTRLLEQVRTCEQLERQSSEVGDAEKRQFFRAGSLASAVSKLLSVPLFNQELEQDSGLEVVIADSKRAVETSKTGGA